MKDPLQQQILQGPSAGDPPTASISVPMAPPGKAPLLRRMLGTVLKAQLHDASAAIIFFTIDTLFGRLHGRSTPEESTTN